MGSLPYLNCDDRFLRRPLLAATSFGAVVEGTVIAECARMKSKLMTLLCVLAGCGNSGLLPSPTPEAGPLKPATPLHAAAWTTHGLCGQTPAACPTLTSYPADLVGWVQGWQ